MVTRIFDILSYQLQNFPKDDALCGKENGQWKKYSTADVARLAEQFALGLLELGFKKGDRIGLVSNNRPE